MTTSIRTDAIKLNLGCGGRPLPGYINVDMDSIEELRKRYPSRQFADDVPIYKFDIFHLPFADSTVDEIRADAVLEHLGFAEEPKIFYEVRRVLRPGGTFEFSVPDFEALFRMWLAAADDWKDFYRNDDDAIAREHWFGQYSHSMEHRWGYLTASIFGNQNGAGQVHKNGYSEAKIRAILDRLDFEAVEISRFKWKNERDPMILARARKRS